MGVEKDPYRLYPMAHHPTPKSEDSFHDRLPISAADQAMKAAGAEPSNTVKTAPMHKQTTEGGGGEERLAGEIEDNELPDEALK
jgi:hypothetical protein